MNLIRCLHITTVREALHEMGKVGVDATGIKLMTGKTLHYNLKIEGIDPRTANLLKQEMLSVGGDAALDRKGFDCSVPSTDAILMGNQKQFEKLIQKLDQYANLQFLGLSLKETLKALSKTQHTIRCRKKYLSWGKKPFSWESSTLRLTPFLMEVSTSIKKKPLPMD